MKKSGNLTLKVKAKDKFGGESNWTTLIVNITPRTRTTYNSFWLRFIDMFPILQRLLNFIF